jgi:hypothetical protein
MVAPRRLAGQVMSGEEPILLLKSLGADLQWIYLATKGET